MPLLAVLSFILLVPVPVPVLVPVKAARRMSAGLYILPLNFFCQRTSDLRDGPAAPRQKYISSWALGVEGKIHSDISPTPNFYRGSKSAKFGLDFRPQSPLMHCGVEMKQYIGNLKHLNGAPIIDLTFDLDILPTPPLIFTGGQILQNFALEVLWF